MDTKKKCFIIGAGDLNIDTIPDYNEQTDTVIAVDGGLLYCGLLSMEPDIIIGDFDSVDEEMAKAILLIEKEYPEKVIRLKPEKDDTDMLVALKWGLARGFLSFHIYGGLGGRLDHSIANIQCLLYLKHQHAEGYLFDCKGMVMVVSKEEKSFQPTMAGYLSLFSLEAESVVSIENMKYPLSSYHVTNDYPIGISNQFIPGKGAVISVVTGTVAIIINWET
ncbi:MAG TPA: thiamine diphosphokinase [Lachnospiraceae bacterium]|nr:thiamine diphosphokinase [Lachnospiraceae bacterium]